jgi:hypothetical protein
MLESTELLIGVYFFNMLASLDLNHNTLTLNTSGSISQSIYCMICVAHSEINLCTLIYSRGDTLSFKSDLNSPT